MIPGRFDIKIHIGGRSEYGFRMVSPIDRTPIDLTGRGPWKAQVRRTSDEELVLEYTVSEDDPENGLLSMSASADLTTDLPEQMNRWDLFDSQGLMWMEGIAPSSKKITRL